MANALYNSGRAGFLAGDLDWDANTIKVVGVKAAYTFSAAHANLSDIVSANRVFTSGALASKTTTAGVADAADLTVTAVSGSQVVGLAIYKDTGTEATSTLIAWIDHDAAAAAIAFTPNGSDLLITWPAGGIFTI